MLAGRLLSRKQMEGTGESESLDDTNDTRSAVRAACMATWAWTQDPADRDTYCRQYARVHAAVNRGAFDVQLPTRGSVDGGTNHPKASGKSGDPSHAETSHDKPDLDPQLHD